MADSIPVETGVSEELAAYRKEVISSLAYDIRLDIPEEKAQPVLGAEVISFNLKENTLPLQIDFKEKSDHLQQVTVNGKQIEIDHRNEHLVIPQQYLQEGQNQVEIQFIAGDLSLNRNEEFLYTLLVPDRARTVFPVFDQPNLKASFKLSLTVPKDWKALANGPLLDSLVTEDKKTYRFAASDTISTYLFSFAAGKFDHVSRVIDGRTMHFYHRETDESKLALSMDPIFQIHADALAFMEDYTQIPYPFQKFDFIAIPDFQYGGMEHVGAIDYKASSLFLDEGATQTQKISRSNLIAHETAHMWFGDLVTMQWFNDVWMKEVFANFMADKITQVALENSNYDLKFLIDHFPAAYSVERTAGANPIRQPLSNLQDAGSLYGNIIYHKAPVVMRQLERLMGEEAFKEGLQEYLKTYANNNATWPQLIEILDARTPEDLQAWNQVWVNEPGRPIFSYDLKTENGKIKQLALKQQGEDGSDRLWPQFFEVTLVYPDGQKELTVNINEKEELVEAAAGEPAPDFILFNTSGQGYGVFPVDEQMLPSLFSLEDPVVRASAYINLYENMLNSRAIEPGQLLNFYRKGLEKETEELNLRLLTSQVENIFWKFLTPEERTQLAPTLEQELWSAMQQQEAANSKKLLFKAYQSVALSKEAQDKLYQVWEKQEAPAGVKLTEDDYTSLALALALRDYETEENILEEQIARVQNPDRKQRLRFMMPALSADVQERDAFFASLKAEENREKESWVNASLAYLHHPLRAQTSEKYLKESLDLLEEIQLTGDIFFPYSWLQATFGSYQSPSAASTVRTFLDAHPDYNPKLRAKILQAADDLFRAEKLVKTQKGS
ncbi:aminopeptidase [Pontibacter diazotrophicus]|uniref:Aminopeptidase N n=1 Tax=Pontibacter diazotrophicus TaxID=1400979 RepID=A0A3D8L110_9BACT|nr:M1 family aminopeptidase [Pontibacter diazotrophicus]RDV11081.1 aminopeptidase [Pontibacter diazotrophicus]